MPSFSLLVLKSLGSYMHVFTVYFMGDQASGGQCRHQTWSTSWKSGKKTARIGNFLCLASKISFTFNL